MKKFVTLVAIALSLSVVSIPVTATEASAHRYYSTHRCIVKTDPANVWIVYLEGQNESLTAQNVDLQKQVTYWHKEAVWYKSEADDLSNSVIQAAGIVEHYRQIIVRKNAEIRRLRAALAAAQQ